MIEIRSMTDDDAMAVARMHVSSITEGFLSRLGVRFVRQLYLGIARDDCSHVWLADDGARIIGFCAYSRNVSAMYKQVLRARGVRLALASLPRSLNPIVIKEILDTLRYPAKQVEKELPSAEILSISVDAGSRGTGLGWQLIGKAINQARKDGEEAIKVLAGSKLEGANRFYQACGFEKHDEIVQHGGILNVYVRSCQSDEKAARPGVC